MLRHVGECVTGRDIRPFREAALEARAEFALGPGIDNRDRQRQAGSEQAAEIVAGDEFEAVHACAAAIVLVADAAATAGRGRAGADQVVVFDQKAHGLEGSIAVLEAQAGLVIPGLLRICT